MRQSAPGDLHGLRGGVSGREAVKRLIKRRRLLTVRRLLLTVVRRLLTIVRLLLTILALLVEASLLLGHVCRGMSVRGARLRPRGRADPLLVWYAAALSQPRAPDRRGEWGRGKA